MPDPSLAQKTLRIMRVLHAALLLAAVLYVLLPLLVIKGAMHPPDAVIPLAFGMSALPALGVALFYRRRFVQPASEALCANPDDAAAAGRWRQGVLISLVCCESVVLFGLALRFIGGSWNLCAIFYVVGIFLMLAWVPRLELPPT